MPPTGYPMTLLPGARDPAPAHPRQPRARSATCCAALVRAVGLVGRLRPAVVIAVGGYASVAVGLAAVAPARPARGGRAEPRARRGQPAPGPLRPGVGRQLPGHRPAAGRRHRQPDPSRDHRASTPTATARAAKRAFGVDPDRRLVLVFGGSLGALRINEAALAAADGLARPRRPRRPPRGGPPGLGRDRRGGRPPTPARSQRRLVPYEDDMPAALAAADVAVCRSGSSTCFELAAAGLPAVLVPSPYVTADQQTGNARHLVDAGRRGARARRRARRRRGWWPRSTRSSPTTAGGPRWPPPPARSARPDAARDIAALADRARPWLTAPSTSTRARRIHVTNVGGAGHERHRHAARSRWATR